MIIKNLNKFNISYKNISKLHKNISKYGHNYTNVDLSIFLNFNNNLKYLI